MTLVGQLWSEPLNESIGKWFTHKRNSLAITITLNVLLWGSIIGIVLSGFMLSTPVDSTLLPSAVLIIASSVCTLIYILLHNVFSRRRKTGQDVDSGIIATFRQPVYFGTRVSGIISFLWLVTSGWDIIIAARRPICLPAKTAADWQAGIPCICQRVGTGISIILLLMSCLLFALIVSVQDPYDSHLIGRIKCDTIVKEEVPHFESSSVVPKIQLRSPMHSHTSSLDSTNFANSAVGSISAIPLPNPQSRPMSPITAGGIYGSSFGLAASQSSFTLGVAHLASQSAPVLSIPPRLSGVVSASNLSVPNRTQALGGHQRSTSASSSQRNNGSSYSFADYPGHFSATEFPTNGILSTSAWKAIHPPSHHFRHSSNPGISGLSLASLSTLPVVAPPLNPQFGFPLPISRTATSVSGSSRSGTPHRTTWSDLAGAPGAGGRPAPYRATSSRSSSTNGIRSKGVSLQDIRSEYKTSPIDHLREENEEGCDMENGSHTSGGVSTLSRAIGSLTSHSTVSARPEHGRGELGNVGSADDRRLSHKKTKSSSGLVEGRGTVIGKGKARAVE